MSSSSSQTSRRGVLAAFGVAAAGGLLGIRIARATDGWQLVNLGTGYHRIVNRTNGMVAASWATLLRAPKSNANNQWTITAV
jgi:hypothetical protein